MKMKKKAPSCGGTTDYGPGPAGDIEGTTASERLMPGRDRQLRERCTRRGTSKLGMRYFLLSEADGWMVIYSPGAECHSMEQHPFAIVEAEVPAEGVMNDF